MTADAAPARTRRRGAELEAALYAAALAELAEYGFSTLSMDRVAARAGTGKAALYRRWPNKHQLVLAALDQALPALPVFEDAGTVRENLRTVFTAFCAVLDGETAFPGLAVAVDLLREPELRESIAAALVAPRQKLITTILDRGIDRGELNPTGLAPLAAQTGPALILQTVILTGVAPAGDDIERIVDTVLAGT